MTASVSPKINIRPMICDDLRQVLNWRNHPDVRRYMYTQHEISFDEHTRWFERAILDDSRHLLMFEIDDVPQGFINIHEVAPGGIADWGFYVSPDAKKGTGRQLGQAALQHAFSKLGLHKICGQAIAFNKRSIKFHLNQGFRQEGILRDQHFDGQQYQDVVCFGLLASDRTS